MIKTGAQIRGLKPAENRTQDHLFSGSQALWQGAAQGLWQEDIWCFHPTGLRLQDDLGIHDNGYLSDAATLLELQGGQPSALCPRVADDKSRIFFLKVSQQSQPPPCGCDGAECQRLIRTPPHEGRAPPHRTAPRQGKKHTSCSNSSIVENAVSNLDNFL